MAHLTNSNTFEPMYAALQELELTENERRFFVLSLSQGPTSISVLAEQMGLPRPNLYKIIESLAAKGLVDKGARSRYSKKFSVVSPSVVAELLRSKREKQAGVDHAFIEQLPKYLAGYRQGEGALKINVLVGQKDFESVYDRMYEEAEGEIRFCGSLHDFDKGFGKAAILRNVETRLKRGIRGFALILPSDRGYFSEEENRQHQREVRYLDGFKEFKTAFHVFSNKVVFWQPNVPMAVLVEDEFIVSMMKSLYEGLWQRASLK